MPFYSIDGFHTFNLFKYLSANISICYPWIIRSLRAFLHPQNSTKCQAHGGYSISFDVYMNGILIRQMVILIKEPAP